MRGKVKGWLAVGIILIGILIVSGVYIINKKDEINLKGQWKVTEYLTDTKEELSYSFYPHYWGRSITIESNRNILSMYYWPNETDYKVLQYRYVNMGTFDAVKFGNENGLTEAWYEAYAGQDITIISYGMSEDGSDGWRFIVAENGDVLCGYWDSLYHMDRFKHAMTDLETDQLFG